ncbi:MAG: hypothetical protein KF830_02580 [Planctomycetes bacterium]|nr:hypothetical protein [Planctomycetota bacterium]
MQRRIVPILLLGLVVAAAIGYRFGRGAEPAPHPPGLRGAFPPPDPRPWQDDDRVPVGVEAGPGLQVHVAVRADAVFVPPPVERVRGLLAGSGVRLPAVPLAGEGAGFAAERPRDGVAMVEVALPDGRRLLRQVALAAEGVAECLVGARVTVHGRIVAAQDLPRREAWVWLGEIDADGRRVEARTDATGAFELDTPAGAGVPFVIGAAECASQWRAVEVAPPGLELAAVLAPAPSLEVQLAAAVDGIAAARVFVLPDGPVSTGLAAYPFFVQALDDGFPVDDNGRARVPDLPADVQVAVVVRHALLPAVAPHAVVVRDRPQRAVVPLQFAASAFRLRVVDPAGAPRPGTAVWSRLPGQALGVPGSARLLPPQLPVRGTCLGATDADGRIAIGALPAADAIVSLRAVDCAGLDLPAAALGAAAIELPPWQGGECAFRLLPPAPGVPWRASTDLGGGVHAAVEADQAWQVSFPHPGRFTVVLTTRRDGEVVGAREYTGLAVTGTVELQAPTAP